MATTTPDAIRDRAHVVVETLVPSRDVEVLFRRYLNEGGADFQKWCETYPAACRRRFQIRTKGGTLTPLISNQDIEEHHTTLVVLLAIPQTGRDGADQALERDDTGDLDVFQIDKAIGMNGKANFSTPSYPDATWLSGVPGDRIKGTNVDFYEIEYTYFYKRQRS